MQDTTHPTASEQAPAEEEKSAQAMSDIHLMPGKEAYIFPASFAQEGLWFLDQLEPQSAAYNLFSAVRLSFPLQREALEESVQELVARHEALRTTLTVLDGQLVQAIAPDLHLPLTMNDLQALPTVQQQTEVLRIASAQAQEPFDLARGPLLRLTLLTLNTQEHMLFLAIHHSIADGWSIGVFFRDLAHLYEARVQQRPAALPALPVQYADVVAWQHEWLQADVLTQQVAYWKQRLAGAPPLLELPGDHSRPLISTSRGSTHLFTLPLALLDALKSFSQREGVTLSTTLLAAFQTLLLRYSNQEDLVLGMASAGRNQPETENLIGYFINTLVLRTDLSGNPTFRELLARVREVVLEALEHQDVPFNYLVKELQPERHLGHHPIFQVFLSHVPSQFTLPMGWHPVQMDVNTSAAKFDLSLEFEERNEGLVSQLEYNTDLFDRETIVRLGEHWQTMLEGIVANPEQHLAALPMLTQTERHQILVEWNATSMEYPRERTLSQLFEEQVERTPDAVALLYQRQQLTYRQLNAQANLLAHYLQRQGVGPEVFVGLCVKRSPEMVVGVLGILKAGAAYVPLDPAYPAARLTFMMEDAGISILLTQRQLTESLPKLESKIICLDADWQTIAQESDRELARSTGGEDLAYLIYTSGSTGKPKGVLGTHRATINRCQWMWNTYPFEQGEVCCQKTALSFVDSIWEIFGPLLQGVPTVILPDELVKDPEQLLVALEAQAVTRIVLVPSLLQVLLDKEDDLARHLSQLRLCVCSGEALPLDLARRFREQLPHCILLNLYGSSEVAADATYYQVKELQLATNVPIGRPIANTTIYLLDRHMQPVPIGVPGELHIGGDGLARGYFNRPELTATRFVSHPFSSEPGARLYKTGDLARFLRGGTIEYLGRLDHQVKLRGYRIELGEIEAVLSQHPAVHEAVVIVREDTPNDKRLIAYVVLQKKGLAATASELRRHMTNLLPAHMVPSACVVLEAFPLTPNGKIDRRALPAPSSKRITKNTHVGPLRLIHHQLIQMWEEILDIRPIGINDDFFALGGHSILAIRLFDRIERTFGKKLPLAILYNGATIEQLANVLLGEEEHRPRALVVAANAAGSRRPFFFLHGNWYGGGFYSLQLSQGLGPDQPFYVLESYQFDGLKVVPSFEEIAADYITSIRAIQPEGPYLLGGFCNGALMAYEMARQLHAAGQRVDALVMLDPDSPTHHKLLRTVIGKVFRLLGLGQDKQLDVFLKYIYVRIPSYRQKVDEFKRLQNGDALDDKAKGRILPKIPSADYLRKQWAGIYRWVVAGYGGGSYPGKIRILWSTEHIAKAIDWSKFSGSTDIESSTFAGTHMSTKEENVPVIIEHLRKYLDEVQA